jgi:uncharacterized GH25 family protein
MNNDKRKMAVIIAVVVVTFGFMLFTYIFQSTETPDDQNDLDVIGKDADVSADYRVPEANGTIAGRVLSAADGSAVEGAEIVVELHDWDLEEEPPVQRSQWETVTDADGRFEINDLPRGWPDRWDAQYVILASKHDTSAYARGPLSGDIDSAFFWLELRKTHSISGTVVDQQEKPVEGAWVFPDVHKGHRYAFGDHIIDSHHVSTALGARTDPRGRFEILYLEDGPWNLTVWAKDYALATSNDISAGITDAKLVLLEGGRVSGRVISRDNGSPMHDIKVDVRHVEHWRNSRTVTTDTDGRFAADDLLEGTCIAAVDDVNWVETTPPEPLQVFRGHEISDIQITVTKGATVAGRAYDVASGQPVAGVRIQARGQRPDLPAGQVVSDTAGNYQLTGLGAGTYTINRRWKPGYLHGEKRERRELTLKFGDAITGIDFPMKYGLVVRGRIVDDAGEPIERARVESKELSGRGEGEITDTLEDGRFEHRGFSPDGRVQITATHERYSTQSVGPLNIGKEELTDVTIAMESEESAGEPTSEFTSDNPKRDGSPKTLPRDELELLDIEPASGAVVGVQTRLHATLRYQIYDRDFEPSQYFAMIQFDSTIPGKTMMMGTDGNTGHAEIEQAGGTIQIEYPLDFVIGSNDIAKPLRFRLYLNRRSGPDQSRVIARTRVVSYTVGETGQQSVNNSLPLSPEGPDQRHTLKQIDRDKLSYASGVSVGRHLRILLRNGLRLDPDVYLPSLRLGLKGQDSILSEKDIQRIRAKLIMNGMVSVETRVEVTDGAITVVPERLEPANRVVLHVANKGEGTHRLAVVSTRQPPDVLPVENGRVRVITYEGEPAVHYYHPFGSASARSGRTLEVDDDPELRKFLEDEIKRHQTPGLALGPNETGTFELHQMDQLFEHGKSFVLFCDEPGHYEGGEYAVLFVDNTAAAPEIPYAKDRWSAAYADNPLPELETENQKLSYLSGHLTGARWSAVGVEFDVHQFLGGINDVLTGSALAMADEEISAVLRRANEILRNGEKKRRQALPTYTCLSHPQVALKRSGHCPVCGLALHQRGKQGDTAPPPAYACPMHPEVASPTPAPCTLCGMKLVKTKAINGINGDSNHL